MLIKRLSFILILSLSACILAACNLPAPIPQTPTLSSETQAPATQVISTPTSAPDTPSVQTPTSPPEASNTPSLQTPTSPPPLGPYSQTPTTGAPSPTQVEVQEAILIIEPGPGSRVTSPVHIQGFADPTFEGMLGVRVLLADGTPIAQHSAQIQAEPGQRGPFQFEVAFQVAQEQQGFIQVYATSPRDGGLVHLASSGVTLAPGGEQQIVTNQDPSEHIQILQPEPGEAIRGGSLHVEGFGLAGFEQTLVIELLDVNGSTVASQPVTVQALDIGQPGPFSADLAFPPSLSGPARLQVRDISPAFGGDAHLSSVEIRLNP